jgi:hypothetical protein
MQKTQKFVCTLHIADPSIPSPIFQSVPKSSQHEDDWKDRKRRVNTDNNVCNNFARGGNHGYAQLAPSQVDFVI